MDPSHFLKISTYTEPEETPEGVTFGLIIRAHNQNRDWPDWWALGYDRPPFQQFRGKANA